MNANNVALESFILNQLEERQLPQNQLLVHKDNALLLTLIFDEPGKVTASCSSSNAVAVIKCCYRGVRPKTHCCVWRVMSHIM